MFDTLNDRLPYLLTALIVFVVFATLGWAGGKVGRAALRRQDPSLAQMVGGLSTIVLVVLGLLFATWVAVPSVKFGTIFTSLGVTGLILGFALKDILENFVAGLIILWRRPFQVGDQIGSGKFEGEVQEINFRSTVLRSFDGIMVYIPNGVVLTQPLENFTAYEMRRSSVLLGVDQNAPVELVRRIILRELPSVEGVLSRPEPTVLFTSVGDFSNNFEVLYWTRPPTRFSDRVTQSDVTERLFRALQDGGVSFPFPITTVRMIDRDGAYAMGRRTSRDDVRG